MPQLTGSADPPGPLFPQIRGREFVKLNYLSIFFIKVANRKQQYTIATSRKCTDSSWSHRFLLKIVTRSCVAMEDVFYRPSLVFPFLPPLTFYSLFVFHAGPSPMKSTHHWSAEKDKVSAISRGRLDPEMCLQHIAVVRPSGADNPASAKSRNRRNPQILSTNSRTRLFLWCGSRTSFTIGRRILQI